jgi:hypothetical protein
MEELDLISSGLIIPLLFWCEAGRSQISSECENEVRNPWIYWDLNPVTLVNCQ